MGDVNSHDRGIYKRSRFSQDVQTYRFSIVSNKVDAPAILLHLRAEIENTIKTTKNGSALAKMTYDLFLKLRTTRYVRKQNIKGLYRR